MPQFYTFGDMMKAAGFTDDVTFDTALPQAWLDHAVNVVKGEYDYHTVWSSFVWVYDEGYQHGGRPGAITQTGNEILKLLNEHNGTTWPLNPQAVELAVTADAG